MLYFCSYPSFLITYLLLIALQWSMIHFDNFLGILFCLNLKFCLLSKFWSILMAFLCIKILKSDFFYIQVHFNEVLLYLNLKVWILSKFWSSVMCFWTSDETSRCSVGPRSGTELKMSNWWRSGRNILTFAFVLSDVLFGVWNYIQPDIWLYNIQELKSRKSFKMAA